MPRTKEQRAHLRATSPEYRAQRARHQAAYVENNKGRIPEIGRQYRLNNTDKLRAKRRCDKAKLKEANSIHILEYLLNNPCVDCGIKDIRVLEFDHRPGEVKVDDVSRLRSKRWEAVLAEIKKCDVRCCNCHRVVTIERAGGSVRSSYMAMMNGNEDYLVE